MQEFVTVDGNPRPVVMYEPYIFAKVTPFALGYVIEDKKGQKVIYDEEAIKHSREDTINGGDGIMRDPNRIEPFMTELGKLWKENVPDWRFSQLIENVFGAMDYVPWMLEEPRMLEEFQNYFDNGGSGRKLKGKQTRKPGRRKSNGSI